jgi:tetratricopeptide (TPR) repeat protein
MQNNVSQKTITATLNRSEINGKFNFNGSALNHNEKLNFLKVVLEVPATFKDDFDLAVTEKEIILKWHLNELNDRAEALHNNAILMAKQGNLDEAIKRWTQATLMNPADPDYFFNLGVAYFEKKKYLEAIENLNRVLAICPFYSKVHLILGTAFLKIRKFEFAKKHLTKSLLYNKSNAFVYLNLGATNSILKLYDDGIKMFEKSIELAPNDPRGHLGLAKIYLTIGNNEKANTYFKNVIKLDNKGNLATYAKRLIVTVEQSQVNIDEKIVTSDKPEDCYSLGYRYYVGGDYPKSAAMYQKYLSLKPDDDYMWYALGETQIRNGKIEIAIEAFKKAIKLNPQKGIYYKEIAIAFDLLNLPDKTIAVLAKAKELGKEDSITYSFWGKALLALNRYDEAIEKLETAIKLNRNNLFAKYYLAESMIKSGDNNNGMDLLHELRETKQKTPLKEKANSLYNKITSH